MKVNKDNICPHCLSKLLDDEGVMVCTGDRLRIWEKDFKRYEKMNVNEKREFLISFSDSEKFVDLHSKWLQVDADGNRPNFTCGYSNRLFSPIPENRILLPDPMQVKSVEKALKRPLTQEELSGDQLPIVNGKPVELRFMIFPDDF